MNAVDKISGANVGSEDDESDYIEIPSFLESLSSSANQLKGLAREISNYYIKGLICYGYMHEPKLTNGQILLASIRNAPRLKSTMSYDLKSISDDILTNDNCALESISTLVDLLPFLDDLSRHVETCFTTLEMTFRRFNYHLNKSASAVGKQQSTSKNNIEFMPPPETRFDIIFLSIMDLLFALISLDETIKSHTNIRDSIEVMKSVCQTTIDRPGVDLAGYRIKNVLELLMSIESTFCTESQSIFQRCLDHLKHLDLILNKEKLHNDMRNIPEHLDEFICFYADNLSQRHSPSLPNLINLNSSQEKTLHLLQSNMAPTLFLTSLERKILGLSSLFAMNIWIFKKLNKKTTRAFSRMLIKLKRINLINLAESNIFITLSDFLIRYLPKGAVDSKTLHHLKGQDINQFLALDLRQFSNEITVEVMSWLVRLEASKNFIASPENLNTSMIQERQILLERGVDLIEEINTTVRSTISAHLKHKRATTRYNLILLLRLVALLKSIHVALTLNQTLITDQQLILDCWLRTRWRKLMSSARKRSITSKYSDRKLDPGTSLILFGLCSNLIDRLSNDTGRSLLFMAISMLSSTSFNSNELNDLNLMLSQMKPDIYERLGKISNCAYLYWNVPTFSAYYNHILEEDPGNFGEINYFHRAVDDIQQLFSFDSPDSVSLANVNSLGWLVEKRNLFVERLANELMNQFKTHTLDKICQEFEIELRLQTHRDLHLDGHNPFRRHLYNFKRIFSFADQGDFSLFGRNNISLKAYVEQHLSETYYNLTSIAPHDWFSYDCMINLARRKYGLQLINSQMPTQTIDCGLDLMEITRNLSLFVSRYSYDMSNQLFVEKCSNRLSTSSAASVISGQTTNTQSILNSMNSYIAANQSLNIIQIRHVSMSIQNHGFGLLNSAINCTYQLMKRLVNLISRQTSDDKLRAILAKQHQQLSSCLLGSGISFEKALKLARKFKITHQNSIETATSLNSGKELSAGVDLDQIRQSLTQLGNSLAFMRLLKSGALNCASKSVDYLPDLDDTSLLRLKKFVYAEFVSRQQTSPNLVHNSLLDAANNFDACLEDFDQNFSPETDYFSIVVRLFTEALNYDGKQCNTSRGSENTSNTGGVENGSKKHEPTPVEDLQSPVTGGCDPKIRSKADRFRFFYLLIPSLTMNFIDHIVSAKERVVSRSSSSKVGALICDDGFSMGVAFLLIVLGQASEFAKLEWFKEVQTKLDTDQADVERKIGNSKYEESLKQTSSMTLRRLNRLKQEYEGLGYNLKSSLLLFRSSTMRAEQLTGNRR